MAETVLGNVIDFFAKLGVYDVLLPFILVFTVMFAILERTKIFGVEGKNHSTKKNLNAMVSFVTAFLVVASSKIVGIITQVSSQLIVLLLLIIFFLLLVGAFYKKSDIDKEGVTLEDTWKTVFMVFIAVTLVLMFANAITTDEGNTWLEVFWDWISQFSTNTSVAAILLIILLIVVVAFVTRSSEKGDS